MKQRFYKFIVLSSMLLFNTFVFADSSGMKLYPPAEEGYKRMVINLFIPNHGVNNL